jgi:hypothetical protein
MRGDGKVYVRQVLVGMMTTVVRVDLGLVGEKAIAGAA